MAERRYGHMVHEYYVHRLRAKMAERAKILDNVTSRSAAEAYVRRVRGAVRKSFGPEPPRTPLAAQSFGTKDFGSFLVEKITYESRPGLIVTGNLYQPKALADKAPAVLGLCGHSLAGKAEEKYHAFCQGLADKGFVTFIIDPISQGERIQFTEADGAIPGLCRATCEIPPRCSSWPGCAMSRRSRRRRRWETCRKPARPPLHRCCRHRSWPCHRD